MPALAISSSSSAAGGRNWLAPRKVFIVRSPSGVTKMRQRAVEGWPSRAGVSKSIPTARISWLKTSPSWSVATCPTNAHCAPSADMPASVLAAEPPEISFAGPIASYSRRAPSSSTSVIPPLLRSSSAISSSSQGAITSTMALPMAITS